MTQSIQQLQQAIEQIAAYVHASSEAELANKPNPAKWSKKEIIGHLIDSGVNNLQRFTEIQFKAKPFQIKTYHQEGLVTANHYQSADTEELLSMLQALNKRIIAVMKLQTPESLAYPVILPNEQTSDLSYLMEDYVVHFLHHAKQIIA